MTSVNKKVVRKFVQVSLPAAFADSLRAHAEISDRSMSAQIEHWARIAKAIETIAPANSITRVKAAKEPADILSALAAFVATPNLDGFRSQFSSSGVVNYGTDPNQPSVVLQYNPDGTVERGSFDAKGEFVLFNLSHPTIAKRIRHAEQQKPKSVVKPNGRVSAKKKTRTADQELAHV